MRAIPSRTGSAAARVCSTSGRVYLGPAVRAKSNFCDGAGEGECYAEDF